MSSGGARGRSGPNAATALAASTKATWKNLHSGLTY